jgi:hypothetical protein
MNKEILELRKLAFLIKREYPAIRIFLGSKNDLLGKLISPKRLFITKQKHRFNAIFTYRRYENIQDFGGSDFNIDEHELIFSSYLNWKEIQETLNPYFNEIGFPKVIIEKVNKSRVNIGSSEDENDTVETDIDAWGADLVGVVNNRLFELHSFNILKREFNFTTQDDIRAFGMDLFDVIQKICMHVGFVQNFNFIESDWLKNDVTAFGEELIGMIVDRSVHFRYEILEHFDEFIRDR